MTSITVSADDKVIETLQRIAEKRSTTLESVAREALSNYADMHPTKKKRFSFIGIGHSDNKELSQQVDEILAKGANPREGWSLD
jgi:metal-responsive CopG/Arc/MetJ family transcriptional regulator